MAEKKIIPGLDVLKFLMALLIVDIHVHGSALTPPLLLNSFIHPIERIAVPEFFVISAFLFFRKARQAEHSLQDILHFEKRLIILYLFWIIVWSPIILLQKQYHTYGFVEGVGVFIRDFFFGNTFDASWFLGALIVGMPIVWGLSKIFKEWLVWVIPLAVHLYLIYHQSLPQAWQAPYDFYISFKDPGLAFPGGLIWITIGYYLSNEWVIDFIVRVKNKIWWMAALLAFIVMVLGIIPVAPMMLLVAVLFAAAYTWKLPEHPALYKRLRNYSILFYVIHDSFKKIPKQLFGWQNGPLLYAVTIVVCFLSSEFIIRMKDVKGFHWLRYAY